MFPHQIQNTWTVKLNSIRLRATALMKDKTAAWAPLDCTTLDDNNILPGLAWVIIDGQILLPTEGGLAPFLCSRKARLRLSANS